MLPECYFRFVLVQLCLVPAAKNLLLALIASPFINVSSASVFLHMTRHYEPVHEAAKHGGGRVFQSDLIPIMTLFFEITKKNQFKPKIPVSI